PEQSVVQNTGDVPQSPLQISVYPGPDCRGSLYQDDGNTLAYTRGEFLRMEFTCEAQPDSLTFKFSTAHASYKPWWNSMKFNFFGFEHAPREVTVNRGKTTDFSVDAEHRSLSVELPASSEGEIKILK